MPTRSSKRRPSDVNQLARFIVDEVTADDKPDEAEAEAPPEREKNPAAVALGRLGGQKGGKARAASLTSEQRKEIASKAAKARWGGEDK